MSDVVKFRRDVAEQVLGWKFDLYLQWILPEGEFYRGEQYRVEPFFPDISVDDDYVVLRHVREKWSWAQILAFAESLSEIWRAIDNRHTMADGRTLHACDYKMTTLMQYAVGDYSRAALAALQLLATTAKQEG